MQSVGAHVFNTSANTNCAVRGGCRYERFDDGVCIFIRKSERMAILYELQIGRSAAVVAGRTCSLTTRPWLAAGRNENSIYARGIGSSSKDKL